MSALPLIPESVTAYMSGIHSRAVESIKTKIDDGLVRYDAWFLVFVAVIIALGAVLLAGMAIWCVVYQNKKFTGRWEYRNFGLSVFFECV